VPVLRKAIQIAQSGTPGKNKPAVYNGFVI